MGFVSVDMGERLWGVTAYPTVGRTIGCLPYGMQCPLPYGRHLMVLPGIEFCCRGLGSRIGAGVWGSA